MPRNNPYLVENKKPIELVQELKDEYKVPSYEEFMKNYESSEEVEIITEAEWQDRVLHGPQFGPGNDQSKTGLVKWGGKIVIATGASLLFPPAGVVIGGGAVWAVSKAGESLTKDEDIKEVWKWIGDIGGSSALGGVIDWAALKAANKTADELKYLYNALDKEKDRRELKIHIDHLGLGVNYLSGCKVCNA